MPEKKISKNIPDNESAATNNTGEVISTSLVKEMRASYLDYAMSVIVARALPDARDGLKPVHRRILYAMWSLGLKSAAKFRKSATVVGEVLGKYHPHGDVAVYDSMARLAQNFALRYPLVKGQGNFGCFTKDTKIKLTDGRSLSFGELITEQKAGRRHFTYTINEKNMVEMAEIKSPRLTRRNAELVEVTLDNDEVIRCTPDHRFMLRDGIYKEAQRLVNGESLMPLYIKLNNGADKNLIGYEEIYQPATNTWEFIHHLADKYNLIQGVYQKKRGRIRHHIDFNKLNNNPDNIQRMDWREHWSTHYNLTAEKHLNDPIYRQKLIKGREDFWNKKENRLRYSERMSSQNKKNWQRKEYREKMREMLSRINKEYIENHPEKRMELAQRASNTLKNLWQDPIHERRMRANIIKGNKNHLSNKTGLVKFIKICRQLYENSEPITAINFERTRAKVYPYGRATGWRKGVEKYFYNNPTLIIEAVRKNHTVKSVRKLDLKEDVFDLTVDGTHNFSLTAGVFVHNSIDGDNPAAMRYTEAKLSAIAEELLFDIDKETVTFVPNYDGSQIEPKVLPAKLPNLLLMGSDGIAVGMATKIPPHNLRELVGAIEYLIDHPDCAIEDLMQFVQGPDFPTGGIIYNKQDILQAYTTGRGGIVMRGTAEIVEKSTGLPAQAGNFQIIISEVPYQQNKAALVEKIAELVRDKKLEGIKDLRDESDKEGIRVVLDLKKDAYPKKILNALYKKTPLQDTYHVNLLALIDGLQPKVLNLKLALEEYIKHRQTVVRKRTEFELNKAKARAHILEGLMKALQNIDAVIKTIKASKDRDEARLNLQKKFKLTEIQSGAIVEMKLGQLANLEQQKIADELKDKQRLIKELEGILQSSKKIFSIIKTEIKELADKYGDERRTKVMAKGVKEFSITDLVPNEEVVVMMTRDGYIKRMPKDTFKVQSRGGKGVLGLTTKEEDGVEFMFSSMTHEDLLFFTTKGRVFQLKCYEIPATQRTAKGSAIVNFLQLPTQEKITSILPLQKLSNYQYLFFATEKGLVKKVAISDFANVRRSGLIAIKLKEEDKLIWTKPTTGQDTVQLITAKGQAVHFKETNVRPMGRNAAGVFGARLKKGDSVVGMGVINSKIQPLKDYQVLSVMRYGFGKRTPLSMYKIQGRGGSGIKTAKVTSKTGDLVNAFVVNAKLMQDKDLIIISAKGQVIRLPFKSINQLGRDTQGVRLMRFKEEDDAVVGVTWI